MKRISLALAILLLSACMTAPPLKPVANPKASWQRYQQQLQQLHHWRLSGLIGVTTTQKAISADVSWQQQQGRYYIELSGPLGIGAVSITNRSGQVVYTDEHGHQYTAATPVALMEQQLGWSVPINGLIYWIRGLPAPGSVSRYQLNQYGTLAHLTQQGWQIEYQDYRRMGGYPLAHRLIMTNSSLRVVIIINDFSA